MVLGNSLDSHGADDFFIEADQDRNLWNQEKSWVVLTHVNPMMGWRAVGRKRKVGGKEVPGEDLGF